MRIHVIGPGVVGLATGKGFARFGHHVLYTDKGQDHNIQADIHFICTPEGIAPEVVREIASIEAAVVIRSSVPPGTVDSLCFELNRAVFHNPEFLRAATAEADFLEARHTIIGGPVNKNLPGFFSDLTTLTELYESIGKDVVECDARESELLKLLNNGYLALLISWWNQSQRLCDGLGINSHHLGRLAVLNDSRINPYGALRHGDSYGGACLPKDVGQLLDLAGRLKVEAPLLEAVKKINVELGGS